jgi:pantothenate kinase-related protein Tda10
VLSIDDFYLTKAQRKRLASEVHPLCITRGPPGMYDVALGLEVIDTLRQGRQVRLPRFDKARDDRVDPSARTRSPSHCDVVLFEGWRLEQEKELRASTGKSMMDGTQIARFIAHYERITRHVLAEMPERADLLVRLDRQRRMVGMDRKR